MRRVSARIRFGRASLAFAAVAALVTGACSEIGTTDPQPLIIDDNPVSPTISSASWIADVDLVDQTVDITPPATGGVTLSRVLGDYFGASPSAEASLIGGDVVDVLPVAGTLDFAAPNLASGRRRVAFELQIQNKLSGTALEGPSAFPTAPPGTTSPVLFSFRNVVTTTTGGVTGQNGEGNEVIIETPNEGDVVSSDSIWSGPPHNFFNEAVCSSTGEVDASSDCFLFVELVEDGTSNPIIPGLASSAPVRVGYDLELTVNQFRSNLIVAADLLDSTPNALPTAAFTSTGTPFNGVPFSVDASTSTDSDGFIVSYEWSDNGAGGSFDDDQSATPQYTAPGTGAQSIDLSVTVTDNRGGQDTSTQTFAFTDPPSDVAVSVSSTALTEGGTATFTVTVDELLGGVAAGTTVDIDFSATGAGILSAASNISNGGSQAGSVISWNLGSLAGLSSTALTFDVTVIGTSGDPVDATATVASSTDTNAANNTASFIDTVVGQPNLLGRWVAVSGSNPAGTSLADGATVANGDVLEFQICLVGFDPNAGQVDQTWDNTEITQNSGATLFQSTDANAHADCADTQDELNEFFSAGPSGQNIQNRAAAIDLTDAINAAYTAGLARYEFTVVGSAGDVIDISASGIAFGDWDLGDVSSQIIVDYDTLTIN